MKRSIKLYRESSHAVAYSAVFAIAGVAAILSAVFTVKNDGGVAWGLCIAGVIFGAVAFVQFRDALHLARLADAEQCDEWRRAIRPRI